MSSPEQLSTEKKKEKIRETCRRGPEDGYLFIVDEVFTQRGPKPLQEPVVRKGPRSAGPHRAIKTAAAESERNTVRVGDIAQRSTSSEVPPTQTSTVNPPAVSTDGTKPSSLVPEIARGQRQTKGNSRTIESANEPAALSTTMPGVYADSDDGGVGLPEHTTAGNNHESARRVETGTHPDSSGSGTPEDVSKHDGGGEGRGQLSMTADKMSARDVVDEGDELEVIFAKLAALNRSRR